MKKLSLFLFGIVLLFGSSGEAGANLITNGDFENFGIGATA